MDTTSPDSPSDTRYFHSHFADRDYLQHVQYANGRNLSRRMAIHERFSTNKYGWHRWVFDHLITDPDARVLELGCGTAELWTKNAARVPNRWHVLVSDLSSGMVKQARGSLVATGLAFAYAVADAEAIPFRSDAFDCVIANHMLYHVPNLDTALSEVRRVLRSGGVFYAATNGRDHLREKRALVAEFDPTIRWSSGGAAARFSLENGASILSLFFSEIAVHHYRDSLEVTEAEPLVEYVASTLADPSLPLSGDRLAAFRDFVQRRLLDHGVIRVTKDPGLFLARKL